MDSIEKILNGKYDFPTRDEARICWNSLDTKKLVSHPNEEFEKAILEKWSHARK